VSDKYERTREQLDREVPLRQELEQKRDTIVKVNKTKDKYHYFRQMFIRYKDLMYRALMVWKGNCKYHSHTMDRVKMRLIQLHKRNTSWAFYHWKESIDKKKMV